MPQYKITDPVSGRAVTVSGDAPPSQEDAEKIFVASGVRGPTPVEKPTSQLLGVGRGALRVLDNAAVGAKTLLDPWNLVDKAGGLVGAPSAEKARSSRDPYFSSLPSKPGALGEFGGEVLATAPLAALGLGPAATGGLAGALTTESDTPGGVALSTALGAGGGKVLDIGGKAIVGAAKKSLGTAANAATDYVKGLATKAGKSVKDIEDYAAKTFGKPVTGAEALGRQGKSSLTALGRREGATPDALEGMLTERKLGAPDRMLSDFADAVGVNPDAAQGNVDNIVAEGRKAAAPLYDAAFSVPPVITDRLAEFVKEPIIQDGMRRGIKIERLKALSEGRKFDPNAYAITGFNEAGDPIIGPVPTWRTWDAAKTGLDSILDESRDQRTGKLVLDKMGDAVNSVRVSLLKELDGVNKLYGTARKAAGDYLSARAAFDRGQKGLLNGNVTERQFNEMLGKMTAAEVESARGGIANQLFNMAQNGRLKPNLLSSPRVKAKLVRAFGEPGARTFIDRLGVEAEMSASGGRMMPGVGSVTMEATTAAGEQDHVGAALHGARAAAHAASGNYLAALSSAVASLGKAGWAFGKTAGMPVNVRDEVGKMLMMSPKELADHLKKSPVGGDQQTIQAITDLVDKAKRYGAPAAGVAAEQIN